MTKSPLDLYKQCDFLRDLNYWVIHLIILLEQDMQIMRTANFGGRSVQIVSGYRNLEELSAKLKPFSFRVLKDDCLDLPPKNFYEKDG